eukprot:605648-Rhodomonas_salina.1
MRPAKRLPVGSQKASMILGTSPWASTAIDSMARNIDSAMSRNTPPQSMTTAPILSDMVAGLRSLSNVSSSSSLSKRISEPISAALANTPAHVRKMRATVDIPTPHAIID